MDEIDEKIIHYLRLKGYQTGSTIAKELSLPVRDVYRRIKKLKEDNTIKFIIRTNPFVLGFKYWARIAIKACPGARLEIIRCLVKHQSVYTLNEIIGNYNILIGARFKTADNFVKFIANELPCMKGIEKAETFLVVSPKKYLKFKLGNINGLNQNCNLLDSSVNKNTFEIDEINRNILDVITAEGKTSAKELSKKLGLSAALIHRRLKSMADNQVYIFDVKVSPEFAHHEFIATVGIVVKGRSAESIIEEIMLDEENITNVSLCIGRFNIMLNYHFYQYDMFNEHINIKLYNIPGVHFIETYIHTERHKYSVSQY